MGRVGFVGSNSEATAQVRVDATVEHHVVTVPVGFRITDDDSRDYRGTFEYSPNGQTWLTATLLEPPPEVFASSPAGTEHDIVWNSMRDVGPVALDGVLFRIQLTTDSGVSVTTVSAPFSVWNVVRVSVGFTTACAVRPEGTIDCWGYDRDYVLGRGDGVGATPGPVRVSGIDDAADVAVTAGYYHGAACALHQSGRISCWGGNDFGKLGDGSTDDSLTPVAVLGIEAAVALTAGDEFFCALMADHTIRCWGEGASGKLGNGNTVDAPTPVTVTGIDDAVRVVSSGYANHVCALLANATIACWGANNYGQLADGTIASSNVPWPIEELTGVTDVAVGEGFVCAQTAAGTHCWGENDAGQLGATGGASATPNPVADSTDFVRIFAGGANACGIDSAQQLHCWGDDTYNNLLQFRMTDSIVPVHLEELGEVVAVSLEGYTHGGPPTSLCSVSAHGEIQCWGDNQYGQQGTGERSGTPSPDIATLVRNASDVALSSGFACALVDGAVYCYGSNNGGTLGVGDTIARATPTRIDGLENVVDVVTGINWHLHGNFACAVDDSGAAHCWGGNSSARLGTGSSSPSSYLEPVATITRVSKLVLGASHGCALFDDATVSCWGAGSSGQLGLGDFNATYTPTQVTLPDSVVDIASYYRHVCVVLADARIMCWGEADYGEVGDGTTGNINTPQFAIGITNGAAVAIGAEHTCALLADETVMCWGANYSGQLGTDGGGSLNVPTAVGLTGIRSIALGELHSCALEHSGSIWCWGNNSSGQLGDDTFSRRYTPVQVQGIDDALAIFTGADNTCAKLAGGDMVCWGSNQFGELGQGTSFMAPSLVP